jgi:hypothetical protein
MTTLNFSEISENDFIKNSDDIKYGNEYFQPVKNTVLSSKGLDNNVISPRTDITLIRNNSMNDGLLLYNTDPKYIKLIEKLFDMLDIDYTIDTHTLDTKISDTIILPKNVPINMISSAELSNVYWSKLEEYINVSIKYYELRVFLGLVKQSESITNNFSVDSSNFNCDNPLLNNMSLQHPLLNVKNTSNHLEMPYYINPIENNVCEFNQVCDNTIIYNDYIQMFSPHKNTINKECPCYVIYNTTYRICIILDDINDIQFVNNVLSDFSDFMLIKKYDNLSQDNITQLYKFLHNKEFQDIGVVNSKIASFDNLFSIEDEVLVSSDNVAYVTGYLRENFIIDDDPKKLMRATEITNNIENNLSLVIKDKTKFRRDLSKILLDLKLKKKRLSDGIYYYGIAHKTKVFNVVDEFNKRTKEYEKECLNINVVNNNVTDFYNLLSVENDISVSCDNIAGHVTEYLRKNFVIDDDPKKLMRATDIIDDIENNMSLVVKDKTKLRRDLSKILLNLNLNRKRLSDGVYYYGIVHKTKLSNLVEEFNKRTKEYE